MRKNPNHKEVNKNMVLLRKHNTVITSLKTFKKPTKKQNNIFCTHVIIPLLILKVGLMQMRKFVSQLPNGWK